MMDPRVEALQVQLIKLSHEPTKLSLIEISERQRELVKVFEVGSTEAEWLNSLPKVLHRMGLRDAHDLHGHGDSGKTMSSLKISHANMPGYVAFFFGREKEKEALNEWANDDSSRIMQVIGVGGFGKTQLVNSWLRDVETANSMAKHPFKAVFCWCFYTVPNRAIASLDEFFTSAIDFFSSITGQKTVVIDNKVNYLAELIASNDFIVVLDGLEALQKKPLPTRDEDEDGDQSLNPGEFRRRFAAMRRFLLAISRKSAGKILITSRQSLKELESATGVRDLQMDGLDTSSANKMLRRLGVHGIESDISAIAERFVGHPLSLGLFGFALSWHHNGNAAAWRQVLLSEARFDEQSEVEDNDVIRSYRRWLGASAEMELLRLVGFFNKRLIPLEDIETLIHCDDLSGVTHELRKQIAESGAKGNDAGLTPYHTILERLHDNGLLLRSTRSEEDLAETSKNHYTTLGDVIEVYDAHPLLRNHFREELITTEGGIYWKAGQKALFAKYSQKFRGAAQNRDEALVLCEVIEYGCEAGLYREAFNVYWERLHRNDPSLARPEWYGWSHFGLYAAELSALSWFFKRIWEQLQPFPEDNSLDQDQGNMVRYAVAVCLKTLGFTVEAGHPISSIRLSFESNSKQRMNQILAAIAVGWDCERRLIQGDFAKAEEAGKKALSWAEQSGDPRQILSKHGRLGDCYMQAGDWKNARVQFDTVLAKHSEILASSEKREETPIGGLTGFLYGDFLLTRAEILLAGWDKNRNHLGEEHTSAKAAEAEVAQVIRFSVNLIDTTQKVKPTFSEKTLHAFLRERARGIWNIHITSPNDQEEQKSINKNLRALESDFEQYARGEMPRLLLKRSKVLRRLLAGGDTEIDGEPVLFAASQCLSRAMDIAEYGQMLVYKADILLETAKVSMYEAKYFNGRKALENSNVALREAELLINNIGYKKRLPELEAAMEQLEQMRYA